MRCFSAFAGSFLLAVLFAMPAGAADVPVVSAVPSKTHPVYPTRPSCAGMRAGKADSETCPIAKYQGRTFWPFFTANGATQIIAFDNDGQIVGHWDTPGVTRIQHVSVDVPHRLVAFFGDNNHPFVITWSRMLASGAPGGLSIVDIDISKLNCLLTKKCTGSKNGSYTVLANPPGITGTVTLQMGSALGEAGTAAAGLTVYSYFFDLSAAQGAGEGSPCITDIAIDAGKISKLPYSGATLSDVYIITSNGPAGQIGLYSAVASGNVVDFTFSQPICPGLGKVSATSAFGFASAYAPHKAKANIGWSALAPVAVDVDTPDHP